MADEQLRMAIQDQANDLKRRIAWLEKMIERQTQVVLNAQETVSHYQNQLQAANLALDALRAEHRKLFPKNGTKE